MSEVSADVLLAVGGGGDWAGAMGEASVENPGISYSVSIPDTRF